MSEPTKVVRKVKVKNREGVHARPVMRFVDLASRFKSTITVTNISKGDEAVDGKSAMQMMLLEAISNSILRIEAVGEDAEEAASALVNLVKQGFEQEGGGPKDAADVA